MTILLRTTNEVLEKIYEMNFYQNASTSEFVHFSNKKKGRFISAMEQVYFSYNQFFSIFESLAYSFSDIELVKNTYKSISILPARDLQETKKLSMRLVLAWESVFFSLSKLYFSIRDNGLAGANDLMQKYPEFNYVRLLRNDFMQHPDLFFPFHKSGSSFIYPGDPDLLPYEQISPTGDGFVVYFQYFQNKVANRKFLSLNDEDRIIKNKNDYLESAGWKPFSPKNGVKKITRKKATLIYRIKGFGLPSVDQGQLATELKEMFDAIIIKYLLRKKEQAKRWNLM